MIETVKVWLLDPSSENIKVIPFPKEHTLEDIYKLLDCNGIEYLGFTDDDGNSYGIYMDEVGMYKNLPFNKCAKKLLGKVKGVMWGTFTGKFMIFKYDMDTEEQEYQDMDITPKEFIDRYNYVLKNRGQIYI